MYEVLIDLESIPKLPFKNKQQNTRKIRQFEARFLLRSFRLVKTLVFPDTSDDSEADEKIVLLKW